MRVVRNGDSESISHTVSAYRVWVIHTVGNVIGFLLFDCAGNTPVSVDRQYRTLAKVRPPFSARSLGLLGDWAFNRERRVFIRIYAHPRPQIEVYTLLSNIV